ncbi:hypothetical protein PV327_007710 [Microctonus hyperodae]|uniref:Uncharacterized protein n=1 Tax=Microctonus hyperodae TaxID=165561 RepID=A0AA39FZS4_MICHY|nr:hypothetical protein PV327_007710 [Microctonus hyperodae]
MIGDKTDDVAVTENAIDVKGLKVYFVSLYVYIRESYYSVSVRALTSEEARNEGGWVDDVVSGLEYTADGRAKSKCKE